MGLKPRPKPLYTCPNCGGWSHDSCEFCGYKRTRDEHGRIVYEKVITQDVEEFGAALARPGQRCQMLLNAGQSTPTGESIECECGDPAEWLIEGSVQACRAHGNEAIDDGGIRVQRLACDVCKQFDCPSSHGCGQREDL